MRMHRAHQFESIAILQRQIDNHDVGIEIAHRAAGVRFAVGLATDLEVRFGSAGTAVLRSHVLAQSETGATYEAEVPMLEVEIAPSDESLSS